MTIGYVMNTYPLISTTFIGREIAALEAQGTEIKRYAIRKWDQPLVDQKDLDEQAITQYILSGSKARLIKSVGKEIVTNPIRLLKAMGMTAKLIWNAGGGLIRHVAYLVEAITLRQLAEADGITHLHAHFSTNSTTIAMLSHIMGGPGYSMTVHGPDEFFTPYTGSLREKVENARFVAAISHFCRSQLMLFSGQDHWDKIDIVHCGVQPENYGTKERTSFGKRVLFVGRLDAVKGGPLLLDAFAGVKPLHPDATLRIVGDGVERKALEAKAKALGIADAIEFMGFRSQTEVAEYLEASDMLVLPSFAEGVPVVYMEAMASRIPVIASQVAGVSELVVNGKVGYTVPPSDTNTLIQRMDALMSDPEGSKQMGEEGRKIVESEFNIDIEAGKLQAFFKKYAP